MREARRRKPREVVELLDGIVQRAPQTVACMVRALPPARHQLSDEVLRAANGLVPRPTAVNRPRNCERLMRTFNRLPRKGLRCAVILFTSRAPGEAGNAQREPSGYGTVQLPRTT